jgi:hypothetical protein
MPSGLKTILSKEISELNFFSPELVGTLTRFCEKPNNHMFRKINTRMSF